MIFIFLECCCSSLFVFMFFHRKQIHKSTEELCGKGLALYKLIFFLNSHLHYYHAVCSVHDSIFVIVFSHYFIYSGIIFMLLTEIL